MQRHHIESIANMVLLLLFFMAAVSYNGKLFGHKPENLFSSNKETVKIDPPNVTQLSALGLNNVILEEQEKGKWTFSNGQSEEYILNTNAFSKGIFGFAGPTPMYLYLDKDQRLKQLLLLENNETPEFMVSVHEQGIIQQWMGRSPAESVDIKPDVVTGATITSNAINRSIQASLAAVGNTQSSNQWYASFDLKTIVALLVIVFGIFVSFRAKKIKWLRTIQLALNTLILGFWCGKFISLQTLLGWTANGMNLLTSLVVILMLTLAIVMPLFFKKKAYYCTWICPFGAAQELAGKLNRKKWQPGKKSMRVLKHLQTAITLSLFFCLWMGMATDIVNYEPFSAFLFRHASPIVLGIAGLSLLMAIITPRPWCRFACPTGQVLNWINKM